MSTPASDDRLYGLDPLRGAAPGLQVRDARAATARG